MASYGNSDLQPSTSRSEPSPPTPSRSFNVFHDAQELSWNPKILETAATTTKWSSLWEMQLDNKRRVCANYCFKNNPDKDFKAVTLDIRYWYGSETATAATLRPSKYGVSLKSVEDIEALMDIIQVAQLHGFKEYEVNNIQAKLTEKSLGIAYKGGSSEQKVLIPHAEVRKLVMVCPIWTRIFKALKNRSKSEARIVWELLTTAFLVTKMNFPGGVKKVITDKRNTTMARNFMVSKSYKEAVEKSTIMEEQNLILAILEQFALICQFQDFNPQEALHFVKQVLTEDGFNFIQDLSYEGCSILPNDNVSALYFAKEIK